MIIPRRIFFNAIFFCKNIIILLVMTNVPTWHFKKWIFHKVRKVNWHDPTLRCNTALQNVLAPYSRTTTQLVHNRICFHPSKHVHLSVYSTTGNNSKKEYNQGFFSNKNIRVWHFRRRSSRKRTLQRDGANTAQWRTCYNDHRRDGANTAQWRACYNDHRGAYILWG